MSVLSYSKYSGTFWNNIQNINYISLILSWTYSSSFFLKNCTLNSVGGAEQSRQNLGWGRPQWLGTVGRGDPYWRAAWQGSQSSSRRSSPQGSNLVLGVRVQIGWGRQFCRWESELGVRPQARRGEGLCGMVANHVMSETCSLRRASESSHKKTDKLKLRDALQNNWPI